MSVLLAATAAGLFAVGTYLVLQRKLSRIIIGLGLLGHGANVLMVGAGRAGRAAIVDGGGEGALADPLPQALALTAIVISFGTTALLLALAYRSWLLTDDDEVQDDVEDELVARRGLPDEDLRGGPDPSDPDDDPDDDTGDDTGRGSHRATDAGGTAGEGR
ncbi:MAG TPA: NADH-quinone oxidoreductase subunit K [Acidimicrobiales bacterium]|nr:NADH-quinone oxidoreductase subunit K [Acidimicrobiales bacterium]